jgi:hypothetical protein
MHPAKGRIVDHANGMRTITLDPRLDQRERNATLVHELVHDELDLLWPPGTPVAVVAKGEFRVDRITMDRLIPPVELAEYVARMAEVEPVEAWKVADDFDVPLEIAGRALERLAAVTF